MGAGGIKPTSFSPPVEESVGEKKHIQVLLPATLQPGASPGQTQQLSLLEHPHPSQNVAAAPAQPHQL